MSDQANMPSTNLPLLFSDTAHSVNDPDVPYHQSYESGTGTVDAMFPGFDDSNQWKQECQQQHPLEEPQYQQQEYQQTWLAQQHTQTQLTYDGMNSCVSTLPATLDLSSPASLTGNPDSQVTGPYNTDWYLSHTLHHLNSLDPMVDNGECHVASLPDLEWTPSTEVQSTPSERSGFDVVRW